MFFRFKDNLPRLIRVVTGVIVLVWVYRIVLRLVFQVGEHWLYFCFDTRADHLAIGCLLALLLHLRIGEKYFHAACRYAALPVLTLLLLIAGLWWSGDYNTTRAFTVGYVVLPLLMALLLVQWIALSGTPLWRWLDSPVMRYCGRISYSIYLYHWFVDWVILFRLPGLPDIGKIAIAVVGSVAVGSLSYYAIELPFLRQKDRFLAPRM